MKMIAAGRRAALLIGASVSALALGGTALAAGDGTAPSYRIEPAHTGVQIDSAIQLPLAKRWSVDFSGGVSYPLIAEGKVFVTASAYPLSGTTLFALDQRDGHVLWSQAVSGRTSWSAAA